MENETNTPKQVTVVWVKLDGIWNPGKQLLNEELTWQMRIERDDKLKKANLKEDKKHEVFVVRFHGKDRGFSTVRMIGEGRKGMVRSFKTQRERQRHIRESISYLKNYGPKNDRILQRKLGEYLDAVLHFELLAYPRSGDLSWIYPLFGIKSCESLSNQVSTSERIEPQPGPLANKCPLCTFTAEGVDGETYLRLHLKHCSERKNEANALPQVATSTIEANDEEGDNAEGTTDRPEVGNGGVTTMDCVIGEKVFTVHIEYNDEDPTKNVLDFEDQAEKAVDLRNQTANLMVVQDHAEDVEHANAKSMTDQSEMEKNSADLAEVLRMLKGGKFADFKIPPSRKLVEGFRKRSMKPEPTEEHPHRVSPKSSRSLPQASNGSVQQQHGEPKAQVTTPTEGEDGKSAVLIVRRVVHMVPVENSDGSITNLLVSLENGSDQPKGVMEAAGVDPFSSVFTMEAIELASGEMRLMNPHIAEAMFLDRDGVTGNEILSAFCEAPSSSSSPESSKGQQGGTSQVDSVPVPMDLEDGIGSDKIASSQNP